ncbi:probable pectinesterase/pectinesterase inhibitor 61 [Amborella trichopoda]|uniref:Pectinesterase inhibitor domain-containing protein n=1 Tax=Amborella trichopoda TaxID=13333 RepID=W1NYM5_AMBTC|nr:probable pectinesterase/pectinesterase inhibitor 61 [Amborella trichopoda]ERN02692.1 hypothetical protein AMTR_s00085p00103560 [Amborella trichopoda]|eukprot:XP_006841017.1 probable pectinesterase/pectinesterase inhibitor 61 [Amborella trichopoda]
MASALSLSLALLSATLFLASAPATDASRPSRGLGSVCRHTDYPTLCQSALGRRQHVDPISATAASVKALMAKTAQARAYAQRLITSGRVYGMGKGNLKVCKENYSDALANLATSLKNLHSRAHADLLSNLSAVGTDIDTCDDGYKETPGLRSPMVNYQKNLSKMASNCLALATAVKKGH